MCSTSQRRGRRVVRAVDPLHLAADGIKDPAGLLRAEAAVERLRCHLALVDVEALDLRVALLLAPRERDGAVVALAAIVLVQLLAGEKPVAARRQGWVGELRARLRRWRGGIDLHHTG